MSPRLVFVVLAALSAAAPAGAESFKSWAARGSREEREQDPKAAAASYGNALSLWKDSDGAAAKAKVLCARSLIREKAGEDEDAINDLTACLAIDKKNAKGFHRRGLLLLKLQKVTEAISDFYRAVALDISFGRAYADRARAYELQGEAAFAGEDYKRACELGVKEACAKVPGGKKKGKAAKAKAAPVPKVAPAEAETPAAAEEAPETESAEAAAAAPTPASEEPAPKRRKSSSSYYMPKFRDCLDAMNACVEGGDSFGGCVKSAANCDKKKVKGCCPAACLKAYAKSVNRDRSEAEAFRDHFSPDSACGVPPKEEDED